VIARLVEAARLRRGRILVATSLLLIAGMCLCCARSGVATGNSQPGAGASGPGPLEQKARYCEEQVFTYHLQEGLVIPQRVDPTGQARYTNDNAGYRTGCLLSALAHRWAVTGEANARERARQVTGALEMLERVTGVPGLTSRQYKRMQGPGDDENDWLQDYWHQGEEYRWLGNVSTDEMTWYLTGLGDYVMLCAEGEDRRLASALIRRVLGRMLRYGMRITEADGTVTDWGDCSLESSREPLFSQHGLHYLKVGELCAFDERFADAYEQYASVQDYLYQSVHCCRLGVAEHTWADYDWELAAPGYELLIKFDKDPSRRAALKEGLLEMAQARHTNVFSHLCTAVLRLGGDEKVRDWLVGREQGLVRVGVLEGPGGGDRGRGRVDSRRPG